MLVFILLAQSKHWFMQVNMKRASSEICDPLSGAINFPLNFRYRTKTFKALIMNSLKFSKVMLLFLKLFNKVKMFSHGISQLQQNLNSWHVKTLIRASCYGKWRNIHVLMAPLVNPHDETGKWKWNLPQVIET